MVQLPAAMRRKRKAITSIHEKPPSKQEKLANIGGWLLLVVAFFVLAVGVYALYGVMTDAHVAKLDVVGTRSNEETTKVIQHVAPVIKENYFTADLEVVRDKTLELSWVDRVVEGNHQDQSSKKQQLQK